MSESTALPGSPERETRQALQGDGDGGGGGQPEQPEGSRLVESVLDNLPAWAFIALAISALYLVWATLVIVSKYVGSLPSFTP